MSAFKACTRGCLTWRSAGEVLAPSRAAPALLEGTGVRRRRLGKRPVVLRPRRGDGARAQISRLLRGRRQRTPGWLPAYAWINASRGTQAYASPSDRRHRRVLSTRPACVDVLKAPPTPRRFLWSPAPSCSRSARAPCGADGRKPARRDRRASSRPSGRELRLDASPPPRASFVREITSARRSSARIDAGQQLSPEARGARRALARRRRPDLTRRLDALRSRVVNAAGRLLRRGPSDA